ncbi:MAG TPA: hypothetical protein VLL97_14125 [Acidobacteriota bacterium]|nr:hypothetical protein [Acidobacteriota bacterium]
MPLLIANIGNRDLLLDGNECVPARTEGERLLERFDEISGRLGFPIFGRALEYVEKTRGEKPDRLSIILFATDQPDREYRESDTIAFGRIIKKRFGKNRRISLCVIQEEPNYYDSMFVFYRTKLRELAPKGKDADAVYVLATAGAPACNMALLFHSIALFGDSVVPLYVKKDAPVIEMQIAAQLMESFARRAVVNHINSYDYAAAIGVERMHGNVRSLAEAAQARLNFDFRAAYNGLRVVRGTISGATAGLVSIENHMAKIIEENDDAALLRELALNIDIKYRARQYADLLGRLFRFEEALLQWAVRVFGDITIDEKQKGKEGFSQFLASVRKQDGLEKYLKTVKTGSGPIDYTKPTRPVLRKIIDFLSERKTDMPGQLKQVLECADAIMKFSDLRNKSVIAHGFKGISGDELKKFEIDRVLELIRSIAGDTSGISFDRMNECIIGLLGSERV